MTREKTTQRETCGLSEALSVIGGKWKSTILWELHHRPSRFGALRRRLPGISDKVLSEQLRQLEADGVVQRDVCDEVPQRVEYSLTPLGSSLNQAVHALAEWGKGHAAHFATRTATRTPITNRTSTAVT